MKSFRILGAVLAIVMSLGLYAGPAQAASDARKQRNTHISVSVTRLPNGCNNIVARIKRAGRAYAGAAVTIQSKSGRRWVKVRHSGNRSDATGLIQYLNGRVYPGRPALRLHFAGNRKSKPSNSRSFRAPGPIVCSAQ